MVLILTHFKVISRFNKHIITNVFSGHSKLLPANVQTSLHQWVYRRIISNNYFTGDASTKHSWQKVRPTVMLVSHSVTCSLFAIQEYDKYNKNHVHIACQTSGCYIYQFESTYQDVRCNEVGGREGEKRRVIPKNCDQLKRLWEGHDRLYFTVSFVTIKPGCKTNLKKTLFKTLA